VLLFPEPGHERDRPNLHLRGRDGSSHLAQNGYEWMVGLVGEAVSRESSGEKYHAIRLGTKYQEQIREYLLGGAELPQAASILVLASGLKTPALVFNFPDTICVESQHCHSLHIPGLTFQLSLGGRTEPGDIESCILRSPFHPIFECKHCDARVQRASSSKWAKLRG
jgi:hypothetical protein